MSNSVKNINTKTRSGSSKLAALSSAALALPSIAQAAAPTETTLSYRYTQYNESTVDRGSVASGSPARYDIDVNQYSYSGPIGTNMALSVNYQDEILSGASPWSNTQPRDPNTGTIANPDSVSVVMSGASIEERRKDLSSALTYYYNGGSVTGVIGFSNEDDYKSTSFGLSTEREFHNKQTVVSAGFSMSDDTIKYEMDLGAGGVALYNIVNPIGATQAYLDGDRSLANIVQGAKESKDSLSLFVSGSRILTSNSIVQAGFSYTTKDGYLNDAYKQYDQRPDSKDMMTLNLSYRHYVKSIKSAWHFDYRFYDDDWGVDSHTYEIAMYKKWNKIQIVPSARYYVQSSAVFYEDVAETAFLQEQTYFSDDARLSDYGAISLGLKFVFKLKPVDWIISTEYYKAKKDFSPTESDRLEPPGLIEYTRFTFGVDHRF